MGQFILIMGVAGCGKSTLGELIAAEWDATYIEGDDLHPESNIEKMSSGVSAGRRRSLAVVRSNY